MDRLAPTHVPVYETDEGRRALWERCVERNQPVIAVRDARRGYIARYDLQHLGVELDERTIRELRERTRRSRSYPTGPDLVSDPLSESEGVGGEAGAVSGDLHAATEREARELAAALSELVFDDTNWQ